MTARIRVLTEDTINKIAAGEVIENPSSVVKELVENSLDAGATDIHVEIRGGGRQLIRITDNGCGMVGDDALLCLERHATSKIREVSDIEDVGTLGFRGEAIPSIASISKFTLLTCPHTEGATATMVIVEGGRILKCCAAERSPGTTIEVKSIFYNVPVRRKFQKSPAHDANEILKILSALALAYPAITFELISDQEPLLQARASQDNTALARLGDRITAVLGREFASHCTPVDYTIEGLSVLGFVGLPTNSRANRTGQYLFINGRAVVSPLIAFLVRDAYGTALPTNRHPLFVLQLAIPGGLVDVNVHPQKREVRLRQNDLLKQLILNGVGQALQGSRGFSPPPLPLPRVEHTYASIAEPLPWEQETPRHSCTPPIPQEPLFREVEEAPPISREPQQSLVTPKLVPPKVLAAIRGYLLLDPDSCGQLPNQIRESATMLVLDQRAAHHRILFERLNSDGRDQAPSQPLLIPETIDLTAVEAACLREVLPQLCVMGFDIGEFGQNTFLIRAIPADLEATNTTTLLSEIVDQLREFQSPSVQRHEKDKKVSLTASRLAVSRKQQLSIVDAQHLVTQLFQCESPFQCPQGRPTIIGIGEKELAKLFAT